MKRSRDDSVKPGKGIDGTLGENYSREHARSPWNPPAIGDGKVNPRGHGKYTNDESGVRNKAPSDPTGGAETKDIFDNVNRNSDIGKPGPIKYGVD